MRETTIAFIIAILCITWLETIYIIYLGKDGAILSAIVGTISALIGVQYGKTRYKLEKAKTKR